MKNDQLPAANLIFDFGFRSFCTLLWRPKENVFAKHLVLPLTDCLNRQTPIFLKNLKKTLPQLLTQLRFQEFQISALLSPALFQYELAPKAPQQSKNDFIYDNPNHPEQKKLYFRPKDNIIAQVNRIFADHHIEATFLGSALNAELDAILTLLSKTKTKNQEFDIFLSLRHSKAYLFFLQKSCILHYAESEDLAALSLDEGLLQQISFPLDTSDKIEKFKEQELILLPSFKKQQQSLVPNFTYFQPFFTNLAQWICTQIRLWEEKHPSQARRLFYSGGTTALRNFANYLSGLINLPTSSLTTSIFADTEDISSVLPPDIMPLEVYSSAFCYLESQEFSS